MPNTVIGVTDVDEVFLVFGGHRIRGFPPSGQYWVPAKLNPDELSAEEGLDGNLSITKRKGNAVVCDLTLTRESRSNTVLWGFLTAQRNAPGIPFLPLFCKHRETKFTAPASCIMQGPAGPAFGDGPQTVLWRFLCPQYEGALFGLSVFPPL
jgi:hypothetical protein